MKRQIAASLLVIATLAGALALAGSEPMGRVLDAGTLHIQEKVESLYARGDYRRAHFIYKSELARVGDKYAQYMAGYMYLTGTGVPADQARAAAWYRLAAERGKPEYVAVRDELLTSLGDEDRARALVYYGELRREYSDVAVALRSVLESAAKLRTSEEGPVTEQSLPLFVVDSGAGTTTLRRESSTRRQLRHRYEASLQYLVQHLGSTELQGTAPDALDDAALRRQVEAYLNETDLTRLTERD